MTVAVSLTVVPGNRTPDGLADVTVVEGCFTVVKHSVSAFVCEDGSYTVFPEYSARQQYVPIASVSSLAAEVAEPLTRATGPPT